MTKKIGYACKTSALDKNGQVVSIPKFNTRTTTISWLNRQKRAVAEQRLWELMTHNIAATDQAIKFIATLPAELGMFRISSDILPAYTELSWRCFWQQQDVVRYCEACFAKIGEFARTHNIRLSFHPGQFTVLASDNPDVVNRSIAEFEYHADMARWMNYGQTFQDFTINVHVAGRRGSQGLREAYHRLSDTARNCITVENEEITHGLDECLTLADIIPIVLDVHHHLIKDAEYIQPDDSRITKIKESWRGVRPKIHLSISKRELLPQHSTMELPNIKALLTEGHNKQKLRAHSEYLWNIAVNKWALTHLDWADIMVEAKAKNLASIELYQMLAT